MPAPEAQHPGRVMLGRIADPDLVAKADAKVASGKARWTWDPAFANVAGLVFDGTNQALVVVYLDEEDFAANDEALEGE